MRASSDEIAVGEARADLAGVHEMGVGTRDVTGLEDPEHAEPVFEVALLDAVDVGVIQEPGRAIDPAAAPAEITFEPVALSELPPEVRRPVEGAVGQRRPGGLAPNGRSLPRRGR